MANGGLRQITTSGFPNPNKSENVSDFGFAKKLSESDNIQIRIQTLSHH